MRPPLSLPALASLAALPLALALLSGACATLAPSPPEAPAPASEPRAVLKLRVDLARAQRCEEAFDLALYQDHGIELIEWDEGSRCEGRAVSIRYLPRRTTPDKLLRAVTEAGAKTTPAPEAPQGEHR